MVMRVLPATVEMMAHLYHPITKMKFLDMDTPVEWPSDQFTMRRLVDGSIIDATAPLRPEPLTEPPPKRPQK